MIISVVYVRWFSAAKDWTDSPFLGFFIGSKEKPPPAWGAMERASLGEN
jgi:hypothetical protein